MIREASHRKAMADAALAGLAIAQRDRLAALGLEFRDLVAAIDRCTQAQEELMAALESTETSSASGARKSLTVKAAAEELGISAAYVRRLLRASSGPRLEGWVLRTEGGHPYRMYVYADSAEAYLRHLQTQSPAPKKGRFAA